MTENENASPGVGHEVMRVLILSRFEDDVLQRQEVEVWLDGLRVLGPVDIHIDHRL